MVGWLHESSRPVNISKKETVVETISQPINLIGVPSEVQSYMGKVFHLKQQ